MIIDTRDPIPVLREAEHDVVVIGGGILGALAAIESSRRGKRVLLLESGYQRPDPRIQALARADLDPHGGHHDPVIAAARRLGGCGNVWGGRCVPYDQIDFIERPWLDLPSWPLTKSDLDPYLGRACDWLGCGRGGFLTSPACADAVQDAFHADHVERWAMQQKPHLNHLDELASDTGPLVVLGVTVTGFDLAENGRIEHLRFWSERGSGTIPARTVILATGGIAATQLLLQEQGRHPGLFGGTDGPLGRCYMGHLNGQIADIQFAQPALSARMNFHLDDGRSYIRRRFTSSAALQQEAGLSNIAFWPVLPQIRSPDHRSGLLSAIYLALALPCLGRRLLPETIRLKHVGDPPYRLAKHARNLAADPASAVLALSLLRKRYLSRSRLPGLFLSNRQHAYGLEYQAEHLPDPQSRITLSRHTNAAGQYTPRIDLRFSARDAQAVVASHDELDDWLRRNDLGHLVYRFPPEARAAAVLDMARGGNHQIGTIRMGRSRADGVVDAWGTCFDVPNLHVASSAILPTSSQAAPTLTAAQTTLRLVDRLFGPSEAGTARSV